MASLYKKPITVTEPKTGRKVKRKSAKWWGRYRDALGRDRRVPLARDKAAAQAMLNELVLKAEREAAGQLDPFEEHAKRPLSEHIDDFEQHLCDKGNSDQYVGEVAAKVRKIVYGCKWTYIRDLSPSGAQRFLADLRERIMGKPQFTSDGYRPYIRAVEAHRKDLLRELDFIGGMLIELGLIEEPTGIKAFGSTFYSSSEVFEAFKPENQIQFTKEALVSGESYDRHSFQGKYYLFESLDQLVETIGYVEARL